MFYTELLTRIAYRPITLTGVIIGLYRLGLAIVPYDGTSAPFDEHMQAAPSDIMIHL